MSKQNSIPGDSFEIQRKKSKEFEILMNSKRITLDDFWMPDISEREAYDEYHKNRVAEKRFYSLKRMAERGRLTSSRDSFRLEGDPVHKNPVVYGYESLARRLHKSKGKKVRARDVISVVRQHGLPRTKELHRNRKGESHLQDKRFEGFTITRKEALHLFRIIESSNRLAILKQHDVGRKSWFLDLCSRTWNTSDHCVLGTSLSAKGTNVLQNIDRIQTYPFDKLHDMLISRPISHLKESAKQLFTNTLEGSQRPMDIPRMDEETVLIVDHAERLTSQQIDFLWTNSLSNQNKLLLMEGPRKWSDERSTHFDDICRYLDSMNSKHSLPFYESFALDFIQELQSPSRTKYEHHISGPEL